MWPEENDQTRCLSFNCSLYKNPWLFPSFLHAALPSRKPSLLCLFKCYPSSKAKSSRLPLTPQGSLFSAFACSLAQVVLVVGTRLSMQETEETWLQSLGWEDPLEKETATHSSTLAQGIPWTEEPGGLQSIVSLRVGHDWSDLAHMYPEFYSYISTVNHLLVQATV